MMIRFGTYEEAWIFAGIKQSEGYFAEVLHENVGHMWGPILAQGFPVVVSEEPIPEGSQKKAAHRLPAFMTTLGGIAGLYGGVFGALFFVYQLVVGMVKEQAYHQSQPLFSMVWFLPFFAGLFFVLYFLLHLTRIYRRPGAQFYGMSRFVIDTLIWILVIIRF